MKKKKRLLYNILLVVAGCVFLFSAYKVGTMLYQYHLQDKEKAAMVKMADVPEDPEKEEFTINWKELKKTNDDIIAWILIPDTNISYPIVQGNDNDYYLTHTTEKRSLYSGAIFMDAGGKADFSDRNTIIYGHNIKYGTMFAQLEKFKKKDFFEQHPYVYIFMPDKSYRAEIVSFYTTKDTSASYQTVFGDDVSFQNYLTMIQESSDHKAVHTATPQDHLVTLSTCSYEDGGEISDLRYVLQARLVEYTGKYMIEK